MAIFSKCTELSIKVAARTLKVGNLVVFPTETVYGIGADATNEKAVARIYDVKGRPKGHPLIVHFSSVEFFERWATNIPEYAVKLAMTFWPGPMTLVLPRTSLAKNFITGNQNTVALRIPLNKFALQVLKQFELIGGLGIAAPSANKFGMVSPTTADAARSNLDCFLKKTDIILDGGSSEIGLESTIIDCTEKIPTVLRPGAITLKTIEETLSLKVNYIGGSATMLKFSGSYNSHYSPIAQILPNRLPAPGDGFIALKKFSTPKGAIRLASPDSVQEFAQQLYSAFRQADILEIERICVYLPAGKGLELAIWDRVTKAALNDRNSKI
jgi:L-threonylcarbamoyladenylate synthase